VAVLIKAGANICKGDHQLRLPIDLSTTRANREKILSLFGRCLDRDKLQVMYARILSRTVWQEVLDHFKSRCKTCKRVLPKCRELKQKQLIWWLYVHDKVPK
jgi:hypothetical protein